MKIEVLFVRGCPHVAPTLLRLREVLSCLRLSAGIAEREVTDLADATAWAFEGSPTVRINGRDVAGEKHQPGTPALSCRLYGTGPEAGVPSEQLIRSALLSARAADGGTGRATRMGVSLGAILSSLASLSCCFPIGAAIAAGLAGASGFMAAVRPWLLGISVVFLVAGFWQRRRARQCGLHRSVLNDALLWLAAALVAAMFLFPQEIAGFIADHMIAGGAG